MRTIIAGSRDIKDYALVVDAINKAPWKPSLIISGGAKGVDTLGEQWAEANDIPVEKYHANWKQFGRAAGPIRNRDMAEKADALIAIWDGKSKGTKSMIDLATNSGLPVYVHNAL